MFWAVFLSVNLIAFWEIWPLLKENKKDWKTIFLISGILGFTIILSAIIEFDLMDLPSIASVLNKSLNALFPSFYEFMKA